METLTVKLIRCDGSVGYLTFDYEGYEAFPAFTDYCQAKEFGSMEDAFEAVEEAKWHGLKFAHFQVF